MNHTRKHWYPGFTILVDADGRAVLLRCCCAAQPRIYLTAAGFMGPWVIFSRDSSLARERSEWEGKGEGSFATGLY